MKELDLTYCVNVDLILKQLFATPESFQRLLDVQKVEGNRRKSNQVVSFDDLNIGVIVRDQERMVSIFEDLNQQLSRLVGCSTIIVEPKERTKIPSYEVVTIMLYVEPKKVFNRTLAKLLLLANGEEFSRNEVPHHKRNPMINMLDDVIKVTDSENSRLKPDFYTEKECFEYIKAHILQTDDTGFENFLYNIQFLTRLYPRRRGIFVRGFHPARRRLNHDVLKHITIETSSDVK